METNGHYFKVGLFVIIISIALIMAIFWMGEKKWSVNKQPYDIYYESDVYGLLVGSSVYVKGIDSGAITEITIVPYEGKLQAKIRVLINGKLKIHEGAHAVLQLQGVTGLSMIEIDPGDPNKPLLKDTQKGVPILPSKQNSVGELLNAVPNLLAEFSVVGESINQFLSKENRLEFSKILKNVTEITTKIDDNAENFDVVIADIDSAVKNFNILMVNLQQTNDLLTKKGLRSIDKFDGFMTSATEASNRVNRILTNVKTPIEDFANYGLDEFTLFMTELRNLTTQLSKTLQRIERGPTSFIAGKDDDEIELKK